MSEKHLPESVVQEICSKLNLASLEVLRSQGQEIMAQGMKLVELTSDELGPLSGVYTQIPVEVSLKLCDPSTLRDLRCSEISQEDIDEATSQITRLVSQGRIAMDNHTPKPGATHELNTDAKGRRVVNRRCYN
ncbi:MAG: hypothetical protein ACK42H_06880 [Planctomycetota bacterium]|jgi:hypothetical protein